MQKLKQQQLFDRVFEKLPDHVTLLLIIVSGFLLARLTWTLFPADPGITESPMSMADTGVTVIPAHARAADIGQEIANLHLLGVYKPPPKEQPKPPPAPVAAKPAPAPPPPKPRTPIKLVGVYSLPGKAGVALVDIQGNQSVIGIGENIGDSGAVLSRVYDNQVDITWKEGDQETLSMPRLETSSQGAIIVEIPEMPPDPVYEPIPDPTLDQSVTGDQQQDVPVDPGVQPPADEAVPGLPVPGLPLPPDAPRPGLPISGQAQPGLPVATLGTQGSNVASQQTRSGGAGAAAQAISAGGRPGRENNVTLGAFREQVMENNLNLLKVVRPSPARENGQLIGFRIRPGSNRVLFQQTGLRSGDIVTEINGMPLSNNNLSRQAMQNLASSSGATLTVLRNGQQTSIEIAF
ncbi:MAG: hypothetical protein KDI44_05205 [Thiothrix sp.]|nr:hypothetical protein [Thiothrix sp.]HPQ96644.1 type II secretion system protein N [Thiolinea sp.]